MTLFQPIQFRNIEIKNRWVMSPMCMYSSENGLANDFHLVHYGSRAQGGIGLIILEATGIEPEGRITEKCLGLWNNEQKITIKRIVDFVHENTASKIGIQLAHAGRKASTWEGKQVSIEEGGWPTIAPSNIPYQPEDNAPIELTTEAIKDLVIKFQEAAKRAVEIGFDVIELHAAHGYLIHQFLSPLSNIRTDNYGGSFENRIRFLLEIIDAVSKELSNDTALFVRISGTEYAENGWDMADSVRLAKILKTKNVDLVDVSSGGNIHGAHISVFNAYQVPFSEEIKNKSGIKTGAVGMITQAKLAEEILQNNQADLIFVARELLRNPYIAVETSFTSDDDCFFPHQYLRAKPRKTN